MAKPLLVLGNKNYSSWSLRPFMAIVHANIEFDDLVIPMDTDAFKSEIKKYNPAGKVPVLIDGEIIVWESLAILEYLAEMHPGLWPNDKKARAHARTLAAEMHSGFTALRSACPMNIRATGRKVEMTDGLVKDIARIEEIWCECLNASGGPYLFGNFSCADAMFAPVASRFRTYGIELSNLSQGYVDTIHNDPAFKRWEKAGLAEQWIIDADEAGE